MSKENLQKISAAASEFAASQQQAAQQLQSTAFQTSAKTRESLSQHKVFVVWLLIRNILLGFIGVIC